MINIANIISLIKNAIKASKAKTAVKFSWSRLNFLKVLIENGYILSYQCTQDGYILIFFNNTYKKNKIWSFKQISKPSQPIFLSASDLWEFNYSNSMIILTTSKGIITHKSALVQCIGGKALCIII